jgi:hypothetical protein
MEAAKTKILEARFFYGPYAGEAKDILKPLNLWVFPHPYAEEAADFGDSDFRHVYRYKGMVKGYARYEYLGCQRFL